jgi:Fe-S-cluster containining protein
MTDLSKNYADLKTRYRKIFLSCVENINDFLIDNYNVNLDYLLANKTVSPEIIQALSKKINKEIENLKSQTLKYRKGSKCIGCGTCCKFAVSQFSLKELQEKSDNGDKFAKQFISVFEPYNSQIEARKIFPEYVELLEKYQDGGYYFYRCPKVTKENRCPDYENRPQICKDFPDNPLAFLPLDCGFNSWKNKSEDLMLKAQALSQILYAIKNDLIV